MRNWEIRVAQNKEEILAALALRRLVFVNEQRLFEKDDSDEHDKRAIHINAWSRKKPLLLGTVRCYPEPENPKVWWGGRLAVHPDYRIKGIGVYLIRAAVETVKNHKADRFLASVQSQNVELFKKLGWESVGEPFHYHGHPHQIMEVDLNVYDASSSPNADKRQSVGIK
ncbi:MSMEG_0567/Sll0786 family nitrogen starvation N-acetyltransferase [Bacillus smithii]|uniref:MSMEG_0567/Sll0786 family nitrogen starvation N-acetyltransferase n=1 Tax=Bacillus smithii TaxID=1479 RepID=UPI0030C99A6A